MILTPATYPFKPYPPFRDPDDWREIDSWADPRDQNKAQVLMGDVELEHLAKHSRHDHPWCVHCAIRQTAYECDYGEDYRPVGEDFIVFRETVLRRIARYLTLNNGRPPLDTFDPEAASTSLRDELLHRDELAHLPKGDPLIEGALTRHAYAVLRGRDQSFKTFVALDWALCLATGKPWQGRPVERVRVLYLVGEGAHAMDDRISAWETAWKTEVDPEWFVALPRVIDLHKAHELPELLEIIEQDGYGLVVVDTLRRASGRAKENDSDMGLVVDNLDRIKRATGDGTVLVIAHTQKEDSDARGYSGIEDDADIVWSAKRDGMSVKLALHKMKDGIDGTELRLTATPTLNSLILHDAGEDLTSDTETSGSQRAVLHALATTFRLTDGASPAELLEATGLAKSTFYHARGALLADCLIESNGTVGRPRYRLVESNAVQPDTAEETPGQDPWSPTSPTQSKGTGPVQSSPTPLGGWTLDTGTGQTDNTFEEKTA